MAQEPAGKTFQKAVIYEVKKNGKKGLEIPCKFNPHEYEISKSNSYTPKRTNGKDTPKQEFSSAGPQTLTLNLVFDTYEEFDSGKNRRADVSEQTQKLWQLMMTKNHENHGKGKKVVPPEVEFVWGGFAFQAVIQQMTETFTMFDVDGTPRRAKVKLTLLQLQDNKDHPKQKAVKSGTTYERGWQIVSGDRLDTIADEVYGDPSQWRRIADYNHITNPLALIPGQRLRIPID